LIDAAPFLNWSWVRALVGVYGAAYKSTEKIKKNKKLVDCVMW